MTKKTNWLIAGASALIPLLSLPATALAAGGGAVLSDPGAAHGQHFHPKGKGPSAATVELWLKNKADLPFNDTRDLDEAKKDLLLRHLTSKSLKTMELLSGIWRATNGY